MYLSNSENSFVFIALSLEININFSSLGSLARQVISLKFVFSFPQVSVITTRVCRRHHAIRAGGRPRSILGEITGQGEARRPRAVAPLSGSAPRDLRSPRPRDRHPTILRSAAEGCQRRRRRRMIFLSF